ncbi:hypothetical protein AB1L88_18285 [Tautonia sp. JC769]|uniref:hypothetical protein n=1 Tax=Tautonia sp. JC769 TaxID=3232135 RepID=UPI00345804AD
MLAPLLAPLVGTLIALGSDTGVTVDAIRTAYEANREALAYGSIRFQYIRGRSSSIEQAVAGRGENPIATEGSHVFDLPHGRTERINTLEQMATHRRQVSETSFATSLDPARALTDGERSLVHRINVAPDGTGLLHGVSITPGPEQFYGRVVTPLRLGADRPTHLDLGYYIDLAADEATGFSLTGVEEDTLDGVPVVRVRFASGDWSYTFWIDLRRGAIPLRFLSRNEETGETTAQVNEDLRLVAEKAWFPFRSIFHMSVPRLYKETVVLDADFETRPDPSSFRLTFDEPTPVQDLEARADYPPRETWDLRDLPARGRPFVMAPDSGPPPPEMPGELDPPRRWPWLLGALAAALVAGLGWFSIRHR